MGASAKPWTNDDAIRNLQEQEEQQPEKQQETDSFFLKQQSEYAQ